jgi:hypothetical protein
MPGSGEALSVAFQGDHAYVAAGSEGMQVVNVSNPSNPSIVGAFNPAVVERSAGCEEGLTRGR